MRFVPAVIASFAALLIVAVAQAQQPRAQQAALPQQPPPQVFNYAVSRNGDRIGTYTVELRRAGPETTVSMSTHIEVKIAGFITAYKFDHTASEHWVNGKLVAMQSTTDDNGTPHKVDAVAKGSALVVEADGSSTQIDGGVLPASLWNAALLRQTAALDPQKGRMLKIAVKDSGPETITVQGNPMKAERFTMTNTPDGGSPYSQDVWYDEHGTLVQIQVIASQDGSVIAYQLM